MCKFDILGIKYQKIIKNQGIKIDTFSYQIRTKPFNLVYFQEINMDARLVAKYLTALKEKKRSYL